MPGFDYEKTQTLEDVMDHLIMIFLENLIRTLFS